ncbi:MAG: mechanosensitive ion channel [Elusimicrobia bacterium]|nr:mechanosensitive ion channel [Elusimicrobiota bacterium]
MRYLFGLLSFIFSGAAVARAQEAVEIPASSQPVVADLLKPEGLKNVVTGQIETAKGLIDMVTEFLVKYGFQVLGGLIVLGLGWIVGGYAQNITSDLLRKKNVDVTVAKFIGLAVKFFVFGFAVIVALGKFGIEIAPLIAGISVAGLGVSFALQGPLSNYASGMTLIFTKPFKVGDIIEVAGALGEVTDIQMARTELVTVEGVRVIIPNKHIIGEIIQNYSEKKKLLVDVGVSYKSDIDKAIGIVLEEVKKDARSLVEPQVGIMDFGDSSVNLRALVFCRQADYLQLKFDLNKRIFDSFKAKGIEIPFPQRDVHLIKD